MHFLSNISKFSLLCTDYRFLEEADRIADNAKRDYKNVVGKIPKKVRAELCVVKKLLSAS